MNEHPQKSANNPERRWRVGTKPATSYQPVPHGDSQSQTFVVPRKPLPSQIPSKAPVPKVIEEKPKPEPIARKDDRPFRVAVKSWWPELLASAVSVVALLAIVVVLRVYDGRSIDELHLPVNLTLNGLVALIATFDRLFLVIPVGSALSQEAWLWFEENHNRKVPKSRLRDLDRSDAASRGAWGSLLFIFTSPCRYLSVIGCVIMVLSLAIPTFTQQLIMQENIVLHDGGSILQPGNIPRNQYYDLFAGAPSQGTMSATLTMIAAIYNGLMAESVDPAPVYCPSGNCTWPLTPSLAVCGDCASIDPIETVCESYYCNYTMPSGSVFQLANFENTGGEGIGFQVMPTLGQHWNNSKSDRMYLANIDMMGLPYSTIGARVEDQNSPGLTASECALWMCINTYDTSVQLGNQTQNVTSSFSQINFTDRSTVGTYHFNYSDPLLEGAGPNSSAYEVTWFAWYGLSSQLGVTSKLNGSVQVQNRAYIPDSDVVDAVWGGTRNQSVWIRNLATSMSNVVRTHNQTSASFYNGTAYVPGVHIDWWWIFLPAAVVAASILLLLVVIVRTAKSPIRPWRSSPLSFLFSDVDKDIKAAVTETESGKEIGSGIDKQIVTLRRSHENFWIFTSYRDTSDVWVEIERP